MARSTLSCSALSELASLLDSPTIKTLIADLDETRWTGRPGYPIRSMVGVALAKTRYSIPTWTKVIALLNEHKELAEVISPDGNVPSVFACYRFSKKLIAYTDMLQSCIDRTVSAHHAQDSEFGKNIAIDASNMPAYANGQKFVRKNGPERKKYSDPDASWGHRSAISTQKGGGFYGYMLHAAVCTKTGLPVSWEVATAKANEAQYVDGLLDAAQRRGLEIEACMLDKGYDMHRTYASCEDRGIHPIIPLKNTAAVLRGEHKVPTCEHGEWEFAGSDKKRKAAKWRCPTGECAPKSTWIPAGRLHTLIPRSTPRWQKLYRCRTAIEREFGRLKHEWALLPLRVRSIAKVQLHADLTILTKLTCALLTTS
jgi:hypothetical protein